MSSDNLVAVWEVHLADGVHMIEFEHGTTSGKRVIRWVIHSQCKAIKEDSGIYQLIRVVNVIIYFSLSMSKK